MFDCWAVVPVKRLVSAKARLSAVLAPAEREELSRAMLIDILAALAGTAGLRGTVIVTADAMVVGLARSHGAIVADEVAPPAGSPEPDPAESLGLAVRAGVALAASRGASHALYLPADVPLVEPAVLERVLAAGAAQGGAIVRAMRDDGTNALLCAADRPIAFDFGPGSCTRHRRAAAEQGATLALLREPTLALDLDVPEDLVRLEAMKPHGETRRWFRHHDERLRALPPRAASSLA